MKKIILVLISFIGLCTSAQQQNVSYTVTPTSFEETTSITLTFDGNTINESTWGGTPGMNLYLWSWSFDLNDTNLLNCPTNGAWTNSNIANKLTFNPVANNYSITFVPTSFYSRTGIGRIGFLIKAVDGTGDKKSQDILLEVGAFQANLTSPLANSSTIISSGGNLAIVANNTNGVANYNLLANVISINTATSVSSYSFNHTAITTNQSYDLQVTQGALTLSKKFYVVVNPNVAPQTIPNGLEDGINYNASDATRATLVIDAPGKDFVYIAGSFNNWQPNASYAMKKDATSGSAKFWLELTGLTSGVNYTYQYWVVDETPIAGSPKLVKTADPYSTLVLSPFDDPTIPTSSYPSMPVYPVGQEREVTVLQTGQAAYPWSAATTGFVKPAKEKLVVYEVLVRDFDANRNFQDLINKIDYFKNLKVNAIQLMPVMEFEGNESWGYNTSFHLALDKYYGTSNKFKEFIDLCHQNGIAVILDVALNHAYGRNPMNRMWMKDADGDGWGEPAIDNPYFNEFATHSYSVGSDFNHQQTRTKYYVKRVVKHWIQEYKIDGFRWDLTKGFTQNATGSESNTNAYQADRVAVLKDYADYGWSIDPTHYTIFEHLGQDNEEQQWANYRLTGDADGISKGIMMWGKMTDQYNQLSMGYNSNADISRIGHIPHGFTGKRVIGYPESHDEERLMYKNLQNGNSSNPAHNVKTLNTALGRMSAIGAMSLLVPGPKMIWHFGALGWESSIFTCNNGTVNDQSLTIPGDCKLDKKPQPQWINNWLADSNRNAIYNNWGKMIELKKSNPVFSGDYSLNSGSTNLTPKLYVYDNSLPLSQLKNVVVLSNFDVNAANVEPNFPFTGTWYNLIDNTTVNVTSTTSFPINIAAGGFKIYGNQPAVLATNDFELAKKISLYPNPSKDAFVLTQNVSNVEIYNISGQVVKIFKGSFESNTIYQIDDLNTGLYMVKITDENNRLVTVKLIKE
jgi:1,4-alpha-glucan branching enzyme